METLSHSQGHKGIDGKPSSPKSLNGAYVVDMSAVDEAGNTAYIARYIITIDISSMCVHIEPCPYYEELLEPQYRAVLEKIRVLCRVNRRLQL